MNRHDVDLHVHTRTSTCGFTSHARVLELARAAGRGVIAVTDHDSAAGAVAVRDLARRTGDDLLVLVGMELSTADFGHVIVFGGGVEDDWGWRKNVPFPRHLPEHWVAIQAHPYRDRVTVREGVVVADDLPAPPQRIDAVEVWNGGDLIKKTPHLRQQLDALSWEHARRHGKVAVASSDGHRPIWVHSFFTRFSRPIESVDGFVDQLRAGRAEPRAQEEAHVAWCIDGWRRREVVGWHQAGQDWRALAGAAGYDVDAATEGITRYEQVRALSQRGATVAQISAETDLEPSLVADYLDIVEEEHYTAQKRLAGLA